jgi:hypothetical protein
MSTVLRNTTYTVGDRILIMSKQFWSYQTILTSCSFIKTGVSGFVNIIMNSAKETDNFKQGDHSLPQD